MNLLLAQPAEYIEALLSLAPNHLWPMQEDAGASIARDIIASHNLAAVGTPTLGSAIGPLGGGEFSTGAITGDGSVLNNATNPFTVRAGMTLAFWMKLNTTPTALAQPINWRLDNNNALRIRVNTGGTFLSHVSIGATQIGRTFQSYNVGIWEAFAAVIENDLTFRLYRNGIDIDGGSTTAGAGSNGGITFGGNGSGTTSVDATFAFAAAWRRALTQAEARFLYLAGVNGL